LKEVDANNLAYLRAEKQLEVLEGKYAVFALGRMIGVLENWKRYRERRSP